MTSAAAPERVVDFRELARGVRFETRLFIDGEFRHAEGRATFVTANPATGEKLADVAQASPADVDDAVSAARRAFRTGPWRRMSPAERKAVLLRFADLIEENRVELALIESLDNGKPVHDAITGDLPGTLGLIRWHAEAIDKIYDQMSRTAEDKVSMITRQPIGVVAAVIPWNFPLEITANKIAPALASGNSLIIKPAEQTPLSILRLAELAAEAGIPAGVLNVLPGLGEVAGQALGRHPDVDCLSFTGSTETGQLLLQYAAESNLKRVFLELGGKSPVIVMDDVDDLEPIVKEIAGGIIYSQGQICSGGSRLLVQRGVKDRVLQALVEEFSNWTVGDPLDENSKIGASISPAHLERVLRYVELGKSEGASLVLGGSRLHEDSGGSFMQPTIFDGVRNDMRIAREEIFGPVLTVTTFDTEDEAVEIANDTRYGLASQLYTNDLHRAHRIAKAIEAGTVSVNCFSEGDEAVPFGGWKQSGFGGREKSLMAHDIYTETKAIWIQLR
ncbi:aldehyde dehydrogenase [Amycolatopsis acidicola]|uniref:Aldehyde dehydrogenase n=1 Tax=Amycolatopsis acidicola TaxID=2596893 RepID=A0A5N0VEG8_9PSEU|nr:aldehyde dehydrogenase [Amycolatopsis acidicola]KAA9164028.1 aldehyde dehydrogenase [Amycolatopsis acidicola]